MTPTFKVCIRCATYNHALYIENAMNGFCMQQTDFPYIAVIVDDDSKDGEQNVIRNFLKENFDLEDTNIVRNEETEDYVLTFARHKTNHNCFFAVYLLKYNYFQLKKSKEAFFEHFYSNSPYLALCEGDDYWTISNKLQMQVDYLEKNPSCGLVYTIVDIYNQEKNQIDGTWGKEISKESLYLESSPVPTLSVCYRKSLFLDYLNNIKNDPSWPLGDVPLWIYFFHNSNIYFIKEISGVYRLLTESASHSNDFYKLTNFVYGAFKCRQFYAEKYVDKQFAKKIVIFRTDHLLTLSFKYDKKLSQPLFTDLLKKHIWNIRLFVLILLSCSHYGRIFIRKQRNLRINI